MKVICAVLLIAGVALACTSFIVSPGASVDGTAMVAYSADSASLYGELYHTPHATYPNGTMLNISEWITGRYLGQIEQANETYNTVGHTNEYGLAIGESTFTGIRNLTSQKGAIMDYGNLIFVALQRAKTCREAIKVMADLVEKYGYASSGESFSLADKKEAWVLEMIGKGNFEFGAVWVARRVPDGHVTAHANHARITTIDFNDTENYIYSEDVVTFAQKYGFYPNSSRKEDFSFSDVYNPIDCRLARTAELRVWSFFRHVVGVDEIEKYKDFVSCKDLTHRMPWSFAPSRKLTAQDLIELLKDHFEGTDFDFTQDIGAGPFNIPIRWRPQQWTVGNHTYTNERAISTMQTGFVFVAEVRNNVPDFMAVKDWFAVDDSSCTVYVPVYGGNTAAPDPLCVKGSDLMHFNLDSMFWVFNLVSTFTYTRWRHIYPEVKNMTMLMQERFYNESVVAEKAAKDLYDAGKTAEAIAYLTNYSNQAAIDLHDTWLDFFEYLVPRFLDGNTKTYVAGQQNPLVDWPGYGDAWYKRIVDETGDKYLIPDEEPLPSTSPASRAVPGLPSLRRLLSFIHF